MKIHFINKKIASIVLIFLLLGIAFFPSTQSVITSETARNEYVISHAPQPNTNQNKDQTHTTPPREPQKTISQKEKQLDFSMTIYVDDDNTQGPWDGSIEHPYQHIQDAMNSSSNNTRIFVKNGTYHEKISVNTSVKITGENRNNTIIEGNNHDDSINITADWVTVQEFTIQNSNTPGSGVGIHINSEHNTITRNRIQNMSIGVYLNGWSYNTITENIVTNNSYYGILNGKEFWHDQPSDHILITQNIVSHNRRGIGHIFSTDSIISNNIVEENADWGIFLWESDHNILEGNTVTKSTTVDFGIGIYVFDTCSNNLICGNKLMYNTDGIQVDMGAFNKIIDNQIKNNAFGLRFVISSCFNTVIDNVIKDNSVSIHVSETCHSNQIYHNNLLGFRIKAYDYYIGTEYQNFWNDSYPSGGNYWSDYHGADANSDGIGDTPYLILGGESLDHYPLMNMYTPCHCPVLNVDTGEQFITIQDAIDDVDTLDGQTIYVKSGIYHEQVTIHKSIILLGAGIETTILDGDTLGDVITVTADDVTLTGFTLQHSGINDKPTGDSGINIQSHNNRIYRNKIRHTNYGIHLNHSSYNTIIDNIIATNKYGIFSSSQSTNNLISHNSISRNQYSGILFMNQSNNNTISRNNIENNSVGISLQKSAYNQISDNIFIDNNDAAVDVSVLCNSNLITHNIFTDNHGNGIQLQHSSNTIIIENMLIDNNGFGIYLYGSQNNNIANNTLIKNSDGLMLVGSSRNTLHNNQIIDNLDGIRLISYRTNASDFNTIFFNTFTANPCQAYDECHNIWNNSYPKGGNFWGDYSGVDANGDGIGDTPYTISGSNNNQDNYPLMAPYGERITLTIISPQKNSLYIINHRILPFFITFIIGKITIEVNATAQKDINRIELYIDGQLKQNVTMSHFMWMWDEQTPFKCRHSITVIAYDYLGNTATNTLKVWRLLIPFFHL